ncbi:MAG TPA: JAB domain-containing protein [Bacteroidales bacterium]|nr:JAB domain-containing protein [Bacteroidales bacterium]
MRLTRKNKEAGLMLDLQALDHIILTTEGYYSFAEEGCL